MRSLVTAVLGAAAFGSTFAAPAAAQEPAPRVAPEDMRWVAPELAGYTDEVLFGEVWSGSDLSPRDRSLVTLSALIKGGHTGQLRGHLNRALDNGVQPAEIGAMITHLAFYAGWPNAVSALSEVRQVMEARGFTSADMQAPTAAEIDADRQRVIRKGSGTAAAGAPSNFTGAVRVTAPFSGAGGASLRGATVRFEAGARSAWHIHERGQTLVVTEGCGWTQRAGGPIERICAGDVVMLAPGEKHWHGATASSSMTHVALSEGMGVEWLEHVSDAEYAKGPAAP
jgi:4-carboxymuconolactone decarboxylase